MCSGGKRRAKPGKRRSLAGLALALLVPASLVVQRLFPRVFGRIDSGQWSAFAAMGSLVAAILSLYVADQSAESSERSAEAAENALAVADRARRESGPLPVVRVSVQIVPALRRSQQAIDRMVSDSYLEPVLRSQLSVSIENHGNTSFEFSEPRLRLDAGRQVPLNAVFPSDHVVERSAIGSTRTLEALLGERSKDLLALDGRLVAGATVAVDVPGFGTVSSEPFDVWGDEIDMSNATLNAFHSVVDDYPDEPYHRFLIPERDGHTWEYATWRASYRWTLPLDGEGRIDYDTLIQKVKPPVHRVISARSAQE